MSDCSLQVIYRHVAQENNTAMTEVLAYSPHQKPSSRKASSLQYILTVFPFSLQLKFHTVQTLPWTLYRKFTENLGTPQGIHLWDSKPKDQLLSPLLAVAP